MGAAEKSGKARSVTKTMLLAQDGGHSMTAPAQILRQVSAATHKLVMARGRPKQFAGGMLLFNQGDRHDGIFLIQSGLVRSYYVSEDARELTLGFWGEGHFVGAPQMFSGGRHVWTSEAYSPVACVYLPGNELRALSEEHTDLCLALLDALSYKSACYCTLLQLLATSSMKVRLARLLYTLFVREGARTHLTHSQLAGMIGSTRQWVSKMLASFELAGYIKREADGGVRILRSVELAILSRPCKTQIGDGSSNDENAGARIAKRLNPS